MSVKIGIVGLRLLEEEILEEEIGEADHNDIAVTLQKHISYSISILCLFCAEIAMARKAYQLVTSR
jgi:hypothetical protein